MIEILGKGIDKLFSNTDNRKYYSNDYEVWEISEDCHKFLCDMSEDEFSERCPDGWWCSAEGCNLGIPDIGFIIKGQYIDAYLRNSKESFIEDVCQDCDDFNKLCNPYEEDIYCPDGEIEYDSLLEYLSNELGIGAERNICAVCVDLAKYNKMTMAELFQKYQG